MRLSVLSHVLGSSSSKSGKMWSTANASMLGFSRSSGTQSSVADDCLRVSLSFNALQVGKNQFRQILAVAAFEQAENRYAKFTKRLAEPVKILRLQSLLRQRIASIG